MSRPLVALALLVGLLNIAQGQSFLTNGLVAYYPFNGNANDASGNTNNGIVHFATLTNDRFGRPNQAYNFIANNSCYISFTNTPLSQTDNWTMAVWINPASTNLQAMAVTMGYDNNSSGNGFEFGMTSADGTGAGNDLGGFLSGITALGSGYAYGATNVWYHIVMLRRSGVTYFYANGSQTPNTNTSTPTTPTGFYIGSSDSSHRFFNGAIDDVRIYNRALSSAEVAQLYAIESASPIQITNLLISPANTIIDVSSNQQFTATGYYADGSSNTLTTNLTWTSSAPSVTTIDTNGLATGLTGGVTTITAICGAVSNSTTLNVVTVLTNLVISPASQVIAVSSNQQFNATGYYNDGSMQTLTGTATWSSSSPTVATINASGLATGGTNGTIMITATSGSVSGYTYLTVVAPPAIASQSTNGTVSGNGNVTLSVGATGGGLSYQWQFNGANISGATNPTLTLTNYSGANVGVYTVVISNAAGRITSLPIVIATADIKMFAGVIVNGPVGSNYLIQANGNVGSTNWTTLTNIALPTQPYVYIDYSTPFNSQQFYRAMPNWTNTTAPVDIGVIWTPQNSGNRQWYSVASSADGNKLVAVEKGGQIYTSTDSGVTWTPRDSNRNWTSIASSADGTKLVAVNLGNPGQIYTSTNSGVTWTTSISVGSMLSVASSSDGTKLVAVPFGGQLYTSTNSGVTWTPRDSSRGWWSVASSSDGTKLVAVGYNFQIYTSTNSGVTWTAQNSGSRNWYSVASSSDGAKLVAVVQGGQIYTSIDSGITWTPRDSSRGWSSVASSSDGTRLVAVESGGQIYTSTDSGVTWTPRDSSRNWFSVACSSDGTKLVAVVNGGQIYTSTP